MSTVRRLFVYWRLFTS